MWKFIWRSSLLLLVVLISSLAWITLSPNGSRWALEQANNNVAGLNIQGIEGRLYDGLHMQSLDYQNSDTHVQAKTIRTAWQPACLLQKKLCLNNISVETLSLDLPPPAIEEPEATDDTSKFSIPDLPLELDVDNISIAELSLTQNNATQSIRNIVFSAHAGQNSIVLKKAALTWQENRAELNGTVELREHYPVNANLSLSIPTLLGPEPGHLDLHANGNLDGEIILHALLDGHQQAELEGSVHPLEQPIKLNGKLAAQRLQTLESNNPVAILENLVLKFSGDLHQLELQTSGQVSGTQIPPSTIRFDAVMQELAQLDNLTLGLDTLGGRSELQGRLAWKEGLSWRVQGDFIGIDIGQLREDVNGKVSGTLNSEGEQRDGEFISPDTTVSIQGELQGLPLSADLALSLAPKGHFTLKKLELHNGKNHLTANGEIDRELNIDARLQAPELASLWPGLGGKLSGEIHASGSTEKPNIQADLKGSALEYQGVSANNLTLKAQINDGANQASSLALTTTGIKAEGIENAAVDMQLTGELTRHQLLLSAITPEQKANIQLAGALSGADWRGTLSTAQLSHQDIVVKLQKPTDIAWLGDDAEAQVAAHCWTRQATSLCLTEDSRVSASTGDARWELKNLELDELNKMLPENSELQGTVQAKLHGQWSDGAKPTATIDSNIDKLSFKARDAKGDDLKVNFTTATVAATLGDQQGKIDLQLSSPEQGKTSINANIDPTTKALTGNVNLSGFLLEPLQPLIPILDTLRGEISAKGVFSGTVEDPQFKGRIQLKDPAIAGAEVPLTIDGGQLKLDINGRDATLNSEFFTEPSGTLSVNGDISFRDTIRANLALNGSELGVNLPPTIAATVNHSLTLAFSPEQLKLRGKVHIPTATITLEGMTGSGPTVSQDLVLIDEEDQAKEEEPQSGPLQLDIDMQVQVDDKVRLSGYGFDTRLAGDIKVRQRIGQPAQLAGELSLEDGKYQAYGQDLEVRRGELLFVGPIRSTRVDVSAVRVVDQVEAGLMLSGSLISPEIALFSDPAMAETDVLSYIVIGAPPGEGGDESAMLARAALGLGLKNGNRIAGQFASAAGIEDFNIGADGKGDDTAVVLSGRLSPKLLLSYRMGIFDAANTLTARYDLNKALYVELMRGVEQAIDLFYTFDY